MAKALVIGGGIAGPVAALALRRAGFEAIVFEARPRLDAETGAWLTLATNGLDALRALEADGAVRATGFPTRHQVVLSGSGRRLGEISSGATVRDDVVAHTIRRAHLCRALHRQAARCGIPFETGKRLAGARAVNGAVVATFEDGTQVNGDLLVGCDGIDSVTRRMIDPGAPIARYVGLVSFAGYTASLDSPLQVTPGNWYVVLGKRASFRFVVDPLCGVIWFANVPREPVTDAERAATSTQQWKEQLRDLFAGDRSPAAAIIEAGTLELTAHNTHDLPTVPVWSRGPMVIVGDAAHAPPPNSWQGASLACEDAVMLAKCLRDLPGIDNALSAFELLRRPRVEHIRVQEERVGRRTTPGGMQALREAVLPLLFKYLVTDKSRGWIYRHHIEWDEPLDPDAVEVVRRPLRHAEAG